MGPEELYRALESGAVVDVRTPAEYAPGYVPGAVNLPMEEVARWTDTLHKDKPVYLYCRSGNRSRQPSGGGIPEEEGVHQPLQRGGGRAGHRAGGIPLVR